MIQEVGKTATKSFTERAGKQCREMREKRWIAAAHGPYRICRATVSSSSWTVKGLAT